jgi:Cu2+-containing amine oxidase
MNSTCANYTAEHNQPMRDDIKPLEIVQPEGPGFTLHGPQVAGPPPDSREGDSAAKISRA